MPTTGRVLHIGKYFPPHRGGMETYLRDLTAAQVSTGWSVRALVHSSDARFSTETSHCEGVDVLRAGRWLTLMFTPIAPLFAVTLWRQLRAWQPHVVHAHLPNPSAFWLLLPGMLPASTRLILHWHADVLTAEASTALRGFYRVYRPFERWLLARAQRVIATSEAYAAASPALAPVADKVAVIPLSLDRSRLPAGSAAGSQLAALQSAAGGRGATASDTVALLAVGRLTHYKGLSVLIEAMQRLPHCQLTIVGDGEQRGALTEQAAALSVSERITFAGNVTDTELARHYREADLFVLASTDRTEAFGVVLLEAMHYGLPIVATDIPGSGVPWVAAHADAQQTVQPRDATALAMAINSLGAQRKVPLPSYPEALDLSKTTRDILALYA